MEVRDKMSVLDGGMRTGRLIQMPQSFKVSTVAMVISVRISKEGDVTGCDYCKLDLGRSDSGSSSVLIFQ